MTSPKESPANAKGPPLRSDSAKGSEGAARSISATEIRLVGDVPYNSYYIGGVEVHFPFRPYPSQLGMINHMMRALNREQNAMIESPTGSGKSLALLCAVLSWQRDFMAKNRRVRANVDQIIKKFCRYNPTLAASFHGFGSMLASEDGGSGKGVPTMMDGGGIGAAEAEECKAADGCDSAGAETGSTLGPSPASGAQSPVPDTPASADTACRGEAAQCDTKATDSKREEAATSATMRVFLGMAQALWKSTASQILEHAARRIPAGLTEADIACLREGLQSGATGPPKIYFGSRTHRQVAQLVDELRRKTPYRLSMAVLGSRSQTCIHHRAPRASSVDDMCRELVDDNNCRFFSRSKLLVGNEKVRAGGELEIWDLEDIVDLGRQVQACPYFASRELAEKAQLVFCPYNYVVDPGIREAVGIDLVGSIVILDEAHNIESAAREAGSFEITDLHLARLAVDCAELMQQGIMPIQHGVIKMMAETLVNWLQRNDMIYEFSDHEKQTTVWPRDDASVEDILTLLLLTPGFVGEIATAHRAIEEHIKQMRLERSRQPPVRGQEQSPLEPHLPIGTLRNIGRLLWVLRRVAPGSPYSNDYRLAASRCANRELLSGGGSGRKRPNNRGGTRATVINTLTLWSMNPGVVFSEIAQQARTVVLTSGTLSPLGSYASELQAKFDSTLEANHVIEPRRFLAMTMACGPSGQPIVAKHNTVSLLSFQDDVGSAIAAIAAQCPDGMLVFAPSYALLANLFARWEVTGHMATIQEHKEVFLEPPGGSSDAFAKMLERYRQTLMRKPPADEATKRGAVLFAVYRGKVSEGIDFADCLCRTVVNIGIPYPAFKDVQVILKREYNDSRSARAIGKNTGSQPLVSGAEWYEIQAFRAFNQALGRCLRHKDDWGAIIMLEARFGNPRNVGRLSKWIRSYMREYSSFDLAMHDLQEFYSTRIAEHVEAHHKMQTEINDDDPQMPELTVLDSDDDFEDPRPSKR